MSSTVCRAKNPSTCHYHGDRSAYHTRVLKNTLSVAREVYQASSSDSERIEAYYNLQEAEMLYYGTEEGRDSLINHINSTDSSSKRSHWLEVLSKADLRREFLESQGGWVEPSKPTPQLPSTGYREYTSSTGHQMVVLYAGPHDSAPLECKYEWDRTTGKIFYEEGQDLESFRILGRADNPETAQKIAQDWYATQSRG